MTKSFGQKRKILYLMDILIHDTDADHPLLMSELLEKLEAKGVRAERKSLYDDISSLREYGVEVEYREGRNGGYYVDKRAFDLPEVKLLIDSVISSKFITEKKTRDLVRKLAGLCSIHQANLMQRHIYVPGRIKSMNESIFYNIDMIHDCISKNEQISFRYLTHTLKKNSTFRHDGKRYQVSPWALIRDNENYYMISYDSSQAKIKHFRLDRMAELEFTEIQREGDKVFGDLDMSQYTIENFAMYSGHEEKVRLRFANDLIDVALDRFGQDLVIYPDSSEHFSAWVTVVVSPQFFGWLFGLDGKAAVLSPDSVKQELDDYLTAFISAQSQADEVLSDSLDSDWRL